VIRVLRHVLLIVFLVIANSISAQNFFNLTADEVKIDTVLPSFTYSMPVGEYYQDSVYTVQIKYPEFIDMSKKDIENYNKISGAALPQLPVITQNMVVERKKGKLEISFCPFVYRDGRYQILVSFMLDIKSKSVKRSVRAANAIAKASASSRYASHSILASGTWAKIRVPSSGVYQLTDEVIRKAGFTDLSKVKIYGYGGALQNETLVASDLIEHDDLKEVPTCNVGGKRLFYGQGSVTWESKTSTIRTRNPYSDYGYYFITQNDAEPLTVDSAAFISSFYPANSDYHELYEVDDYSWFHGGRNLYDQYPITTQRQYTITTPVNTGAAKLSISVSAGTLCTYSVAINGKNYGNVPIKKSDYDKGNSTQMVFTLTADEIKDVTSYVVTVTSNDGVPLRLDYIDMYHETPKAAPNLNTTLFASPEYVYNITNQDLHADSAYDMVIIIPTSQKLYTQAKRLADFHAQRDGLRVRIVPADELFNEFSSGTPDASAYRRYMKMLYDRAQTDANMPKYLLLFGDCAWDNRMLTTDWTGVSTDDYLLCYESENSFSEVNCYVDDGFFTLLDDGEGSSTITTDKQDIAVGRFPVVTETDAQTVVDKTINYANNTNAGSWQNTIMFMGDDGNANLHMDDVNQAANRIETLYPNYLLKKVMWDAYTRETSSTGNTYPEVSRIIRQQQAAGALIMDYGGHGRIDQISHEAVLKLTDFENFTNTNLPLWITASCDIMPFDGSSLTIGEAAMLNSKGGTVAFFGTTRTVYANYNKSMNIAFLTYVLGKDNGKPRTLGESQRLAKNYLITSGQDQTVNKLQYSLLGDPALALHTPTQQIIIDSINGIAVSNTNKAACKAGSKVRISGHIEKDNTLDTSFNGLLTTTVRDTRELITCKRNDPELVANDIAAFTYYDRTKTLFIGSDSVRKGRFAFSFAMPLDINYANGTGLINAYAVNNDHSAEANGSNDDFIVGETASLNNDSIGPSIYCYLNSPSFTDGGSVNTTPYFAAEITDKDGINASGTGIGHDLELIIDDDMAKTYILNENFTYDFGSYIKGSTYYNIPELAAGAHTLKFRAWDILNNSSTSVLNFKVVKSLQPQILSVSCTNNPATTSTTFIINHDRAGCVMDVEITIFDLSGRALWTHEESGTSSANTYTVSWDLTTGDGKRLQTGVYLYRIRMSSDGSTKTSKAKKLVIINNN
jgi:hypothetical protein